MKRVWLLMVLLVFAVSVAQAAVGQTVQPVTWTGLVNATATGNTLQNAGGPGSGGMSSQQLSSGTFGFVSFTVTDPSMDYVVSLGNGNGGCCIGAWALHVSMYGAEVREAGPTWTMSNAAMNTEIVQGDFLGISVVNGSVNYFKNGRTFYTSPNVPSYFPLRVFASLWSFGATVNNANLSSTFAHAPVPSVAARIVPFVSSPDAPWFPLR